MHRAAAETQAATSTLHQPRKDRALPQGILPRPAAPVSDCDSRPTPWWRLWLHFDELLLIFISFKLMRVVCANTITSAEGSP